MSDINILTDFLTVFESLISNLKQFRCHFLECLLINDSMMMIIVGFTMEFVLRGDLHRRLLRLWPAIRFKLSRHLAISLLEELLRGSKHGMRRLTFHPYFLLRGHVSQFRLCRASVLLIANL